MINKLIEDAIRAFDFENYGLHDVEPRSEFAEWVPDLASAIIDAIRPAIMSASSTAPELFARDGERL